MLGRFEAAAVPSLLVALLTCSYTDGAQRYTLVDRRRGPSPTSPSSPTTLSALPSEILPRPYSVHLLLLFPEAVGAMKTDRLHDAAMALQHVLGQANIQFGIFGGYAVAVLGGVRESKDVDCIASITKEAAVALLNGNNGFTVIPQTRQDCVAFFWDEPGKNTGVKVNPVLVEMFCERFPGMLHRPGRLCMSHDMPIPVSIPSTVILTPSSSIQEHNIQ